MGTNGQVEPLPRSRDVAAGLTGRGRASWSWATLTITAANVRDWRSLGAAASDSEAAWVLQRFLFTARGRSVDALTILRSAEYPGYEVRVAGRRITSVGRADARGDA